MRGDETLPGRYCRETWRRTEAHLAQKLPEGCMAESMTPGCHPDFLASNEIAEQAMLTEIIVLLWPHLPQVTSGFFETYQKYIFYIKMFVLNLHL